MVYGANVGPQASRNYAKRIQETYDQFYRYEFTCITSLDRRGLFSKLLRIIRFLHIYAYAKFAFMYGWSNHYGSEGVLAINNILVTLIWMLSWAVHH